jgi:hypothetical protein
MYIFSRGEFGVMRADNWKLVGTVVFDVRRPPFVLGNNRFTFAPDYLFFPIMVLRQDATNQIQMKER